MGGGGGCACSSRICHQMAGPVGGGLPYPWSRCGGGVPLTHGTGGAAGGGIPLFFKNLGGRVD